MGYSGRSEGQLLTRAGYATRLFVGGKITDEEFERRIGVLMQADKLDDPYIVDAGPNGFQEP
jgi:hypothetical protein